MLTFKRLVRECGAIDRLSPSTVASRKVATLAHKPPDDTVEDGAAVMKRHLRNFASAELASAESAKVCSRLRNLILEELHDNAADTLAIDVNIEEDAWINGHFGS